MDNALKWIEGNPTLLLGLITVLLILNLLVIFILASRFAELRREIKGLGFGSNSLRQVTGNGLGQTVTKQSQQTSASKSTSHGLPDSLLIEKAIAMIKASIPLSQIQLDLGIDSRYLEILVKQHKP